MTVRIKKKRMFQKFIVKYQDIFGDMINISAQTIYLIGSLVALRASKFFEGYEVCLDWNMYLGETDCELEIEYTTKNSPQNVLEMINKWVFIDLDIRIPGKNSRFLQTI